MKNLLPFLFITILIISGCGQQNKQGENQAEEMTMLKEQIDKFAATELKYDDSILDERQKVVVENLYRAAKIMDEIFLDQVYSKNNQIKADLLSQENEKSNLRLELFNIMFGPFNRLEHDTPFIGTEQKPVGANFYPEDMTKEEFEQWIKDHPEDEKAFTSEFTVIRRDGPRLIAIPYSEYYKEKLSEAAKYLLDAAESADNISLKNYLTTRAYAFQNNDYFESDMKWMDLKDHKIEIVIGPYEVYEDGMFNYKASFESFLTIEDPVEYKILGINQVQINPGVGLSFASGLRSFLRQDPNIILVGEIRDRETADLAVQASLTGHLVFATLHTNDAAGALPRLLDMGAEPFLLASSMTAIVAQRVLRKIDESSKEEYEPDPKVVEDIKTVLGNLLPTNKPIKLYRGKPTPDNNNSGYKGRIGIFEVMPVSDKIGRLILERSPASSLQKEAVTEGMITLKQDGYLKALEGITSIEEVVRVAQE